MNLAKSLVLSASLLFALVQRGQAQNAQRPEGLDAELEKISAVYVHMGEVQQVDLSEYPKMHEYLVAMAEKDFGVPHPDLYLEGNDQFQPIAYTMFPKSGTNPGFVFSPDLFSKHADDFEGYWAHEFGHVLVKRKGITLSDKDEELLCDLEAVLKGYGAKRSSNLERSLALEKQFMGVEAFNALAALPVVQINQDTVLINVKNVNWSQPDSLQAIIQQAPFAERAIQSIAAMHQRYPNQKIPLADITGSLLSQRAAEVDADPSESYPATLTRLAQVKIWRQAALSSDFAQGDPTRHLPGR